MRKKTICLSFRFHLFKSDKKWENAKKEKNLSYKCTTHKLNDKTRPHTDKTYIAVTDLGIDNSVFSSFHF